MHFVDYQALAQRTEKALDVSGALQHGMLGIITEAGELGDTIKKHVIYGQPLDEPDPKTGQTKRENIQEEVGDLLWYIAVICNAAGIRLDRAASDNIAKLQKRYPDKYSDSLARERLDKVRSDAGKDQRLQDFETAGSITGRFRSDQPNRENAFFDKAHANLDAEIAAGRMPPVLRNSPPDAPIVKQIGDKFYTEDEDENVRLERTGGMGED